jgi:hypothetical protein
MVRVKVKWITIPLCLVIGTLSAINHWWLLWIFTLSTGAVGIVMQNEYVNIKLPKPTKEVSKSQSKTAIKPVGVKIKW